MSLRDINSLVLRDVLTKIEVAAVPYNKFLESDATLLIAIVDRRDRSRVFWRFVSRPHRGLPAASCAMRRLVRIQFDRDCFVVHFVFLIKSLALMLVTSCRHDHQTNQRHNGRNQGPTRLDYFGDIDNLVLADGLRGNSRLKVFRANISRSRGVGNQALLAIAGAVKESRGLVDLDLSYRFDVNDETWGAVCDSLKTHPTLEVLNLQTMRTVGGVGTLAPAVVQSRIQTLVNMLKVNMSIHTIRLNECFYKHHLYQGSVIPYLETNRLWPRLLAIQKALPIAYSGKVLGRALLAVRTDPNRFWMLLSGNAKATFLSTTATTTAAANLPTCANVAANENGAPVVGPTFATASSSGVAPAAGQKPNACP
jgi:hypothetical protein